MSGKNNPKAYGGENVSILLHTFVNCCFLPKRVSKQTCQRHFVFNSLEIIYQHLSNDVPYLRDDIRRTTNS